ncbi:MAG: FAD-dependent oxidoreductase [Candidatus Thermoplasmatota archaeon]
MIEQRNNKGNIGIIGAGIAGLAAGALLTKKGYQVTIFEKEPFIGGRALSLETNKLTPQTYTDILSKFNMNIPFAEPSLEEIFNKNLIKDHIIDLGYHVIGGGIVSTLNRIISAINDNIELIGSRLAYIHPDNTGFDYPYLKNIEKIKMLPTIIHLLLARESTMRKLDNIPMSETIKKYNSGKMNLTLELFSRVITTMNNLDEISTGETLRAQRGLIGSSTPVVYPKNGLSTISKTLSSYITKNKGSIHTCKKVDKIIIEDNKAVGLKTNKEEHLFDAILSNILVQKLPDILPTKNNLSPYINYLQSLKGTGSLCAYYSLKNIDKKLIGKSFLFIERNAGVSGNDAVGMIDFMITTPNSGLTPPSKYLIQAYIICTPEEAKTRVTLNHLKEILDKHLSYLISDYKKQLNWAIYPAVWHLDGVAKTIKNTKPDIESPIKNLYLIGDCVKAPGIGITCALNSAQIITQRFF